MSTSKVVAEALMLLTLKAYSIRKKSSILLNKPRCSLQQMKRKYYCLAESKYHHYLTKSIHTFAIPFHISSMTKTTTTNTSSLRRTHCAFTEIFTFSVILGISRVLSRGQGTGIEVNYTTYEEMVSWFDKIAQHNPSVSFHSFLLLQLFKCFVLCLVLLWEC